MTDTAASAAKRVSRATSVVISAASATAVKLGYLRRQISQRLPTIRNSAMTNLPRNDYPAPLGIQNNIESQENDSQAKYRGQGHASMAIPQGSNQHANKRNVSSPVEVLDPAHLILPLAENDPRVRERKLADNKEELDKLDPRRTVLYLSDGELILPPGINTCIGNS